MFPGACRVLSCRLLVAIPVLVVCLSSHFIVLLLSPYQTKHKYYIMYAASGKSSRGPVSGFLALSCRASVKIIFICGGVWILSSSTTGCAAPCSISVICVYLLRRVYFIILKCASSTVTWTHSSAWLAGCLPGLAQPTVSIRRTLSHDHSLKLKQKQRTLHFLL